MVEAQGQTVKDKITRTLVEEIEILSEFHR